MGRSLARIEDRRGAYSALVGRPDGKKPLGGPTRTDLAQDRDRRQAFVNAVMNFRVS
jgi:hypothetical protein